MKQNVIEYISGIILYIFTEQMIRISHIFDRAFIKGQALGKLTACENDFAWLSLINKFSLNHFALLSKKVTLLLTMLMKPFHLKILWILMHKKNS